jgi:hypothetical protein
MRATVSRGRQIGVVDHEHSSKCRMAEFSCTTEQIFHHGTIIVVITRAAGFLPFYFNQPDVPLTRVHGCGVTNPQVFLGLPVRCTTAFPVVIDVDDVPAECLQLERSRNKAKGPGPRWGFFVLCLPGRLGSGGETACDGRKKIVGFSDGVPRAYR